MREPDFFIGPKHDPQIRRWWVIPRNQKRPNIYLHHIMRSDADDAMHDHPWWNVSIVLSGGYLEHTPKGKKWRGRGSVVIRRPEALHALEIVPARAADCWSLFLTGPVVRTWGFACPKGWVPWTAFVEKRDNSSVGRGCGEQDA